MQSLINKIKRVAKVIRNDKAIIITVHKKDLVVDAYNNSPEDVRIIAANFFKTVYNK